MVATNLKYKVLDMVLEAIKDRPEVWMNSRLGDADIRVSKTDNLHLQVRVSPPDSAPRYFTIKVSESL